MPALSAGLLLWRRGDGGATEVLLVHPGGPLWARREWGAWSVPKGEVPDPSAPDAELVAEAEREFAEELGQPAPAGPREDLGEVRQRSGKRVRAWAVAGDLDVATVRSNTFTMEWPPRSGRTATFPEVDRAAWFGLDEARRRILEGQRPLLDRLEARGP